MRMRRREKMMLIDTSKCTACRGCQVSCKQWHQLKTEGYIQDPISGEWKTSFFYEDVEPYQNPPDLSGITWTLVRFKEVVGLGLLKYLEWLFFKDQCRHCTGMKGAPCQRACPVSGAIVEEAGGAIVMTNDCDPDICITPDGKRPCEEACPYNVPRWEYMLNGAGTGNKEKKCDFCYDRIADGKTPLCAKTCPPEAVVFGDSRSVRDEAKRRLSNVRSDYPDANIYPHEACGCCGTRVIWLLTHDPSVYKLPEVKPHHGMKM